ncbi:peptidylprolyl isomerase [Tenacibaculum jejuense]|uniref:Peptidyl-prolyl cis-trans isomerase n=1 Tax=Tenacibaculum jejuense TaxID=584609 RepID=A0A238U8W8_9FLAO|nr:peptidylprolyl isomerase [Tenacibaculum jejuense]SNR15643.1 peptidyl-prolyl cis-trans isomerase [Tenacibaculum jejuense]
MKTKFIFTISLFISITLFSQKDEVLLTINKTPIYVSEFKRVYEKNLDQIKEEEKDIDKNLNLFINYKLKLIDAYQLKLDTSKTYKSELNSYKNQLMTPYLHDDEFKQKMVKEAYDRTLEEVRASHILLAYPKNSDKKDSLTLKKKLEEVRTRILNGEAFEKVAKEVSSDPSAKINGGDLGYFSAFRMVYQFEDAAYKTKVGDISKPFGTRFGYHILKVTDKRKSRGEVEAAHILIRNTEAKGKSKIDSIYKQILSGLAFGDAAKEYSEDKGSAVNGGKLPRFGSGRMVLPFENAVMDLQKINDVSKPFKTRFGWHIVKLLKKYPVKTFEEMKEDLQRKIRTSNRGNLSTQRLIKKLKKDYQPQENGTLIHKMSHKEPLTKQDSLTVVYTIKDKKITLNEFLDFSQNKRYITTGELWEKFKDQEILNYYKNNLEHIYPEYKYTLQEYKDGLLLFDLMKMKVWNKSQNDSEELLAFFNKNKKDYKSEDLEKVRGEVINDFQKHLEDQWINDLKSSNKVKINKKVLKRVKKFYNK